MAVKIAQTEEVKKFLDIVSGMTSDKGNPRAKKIVHRIFTDLFDTIEEFDVQPHEFRAAIDYFNDLGQSMEAGLLTPGLGLEHFLDLRMDAEDKAAGVKQGTPRTIEGPLYVANAPLSKGSVRLDDGTDGGEVLFMHGVVRDLDGKPVGGAIVDAWRAGRQGLLLQAPTTRARPNTTCDGASKQVRTAVMNFRTIIPSRIRLPARRTDPAPAGSAWPSWPTTSTHPFLRVGARPSSPDDADQYRRRRAICTTTSHSQHAKGSFRRSYGMKDARKMKEKEPEHALLGNRVRFQPQPLSRRERGRGRWSIRRRVEAA